MKLEELIELDILDHLETRMPNSTGFGTYVLTEEMCRVAPPEKWEEILSWAYQLDAIKRFMAEIEQDSLELESILGMDDVLQEQAHRLRPKETYRRNWAYERIRVELTSNSMMIKDMKDQKQPWYQRLKAFLPYYRSRLLAEPVKLKKVQTGATGPRGTMGKIKISLSWYELEILRDGTAKKLQQACDTCGVEL